MIAIDMYNMYIISVASLWTWFWSEINRGKFILGKAFFNNCCAALLNIMLDPAVVSG